MRSSTSHVRWTTLVLMASAACGGDDPAAGDASVVGDAMVAMDCPAPPVATVLADMQADATGLIADATDLFWIDRGAPGGATVRRMPRAGGPSTVVAAGLMGPTSLLIRAGFLYWGQEDGAIMRNDLSGGDPVEVTRATGPVLDLDVDATRACWLVRGGGLECWEFATQDFDSVFPGAFAEGELVLDGAAVVFLDAGRLSTIPVDGSAAVTRVDAVDGGRTVAIDADRYYVGTDGGVTIVPRAGGAFRQVGMGMISDLRLAGGTAYWVDRTQDGAGCSGGPRLVRYREGMGTTTLAGEASTLLVSGLFVDETGAFVSTPNRILRLADAP